LFHNSFDKGGVGCIDFEIRLTLRVIALPPHGTRKHLDAPFEIAHDISLPKAQNPPAGVDQLSSVPKIAPYVSEDFRNPILLVVRLYELGREGPESSSPPLNSVPEITIDKDGQLLEGKNEVRLSAKMRGMCLESKSGLSESPYQCHFRLRIPAVHAPHDF